MPNADHPAKADAGSPFQFNGGIRLFKSFLFVLALLTTPELIAQTSDNEPAGRMDQIQAERMKKAADIKPPPPVASESFFTRIGSVIRRSHLRAGVEGLGPGAGLTVGSFFEWSKADDRVRPQLWGTYTVGNFYNV